MYELSYDYVKPKYSEKAKLCYMDTGICKDITEDLEETFVTSNQELDKELTKEKIKK